MTKILQSPNRNWRAERQSPLQSYENGGAKARDLGLYDWGGAFDISLRTLTVGSEAARSIVVTSRLEMASGDVLAVSSDAI
jgi:hypothetical protein